MVTPDNILSETLEQFLSGDEEAIQSFEGTANLVRAILFSVFPDRQRYALRVLREEWGPNIEVAKTEGGGIIKSYISLIGKDGPYIYVEDYNSDHPLEEEAPSSEEMRNWENV